MMTKANFWLNTHINLIGTKRAFKWYQQCRFAEAG